MVRVVLLLNADRVSHQQIFVFLREQGIQLTFKIKTPKQLWNLSKLAIKAPERPQLLSPLKSSENRRFSDDFKGNRSWRCSVIFIVNFEQISDSVLMFPMLTLNNYIPAGNCLMLTLSECSRVDTENCNWLKWMGKLGTKNGLTP